MEKADLVNRYLENFKDLRTENDSFNIVNEEIYSWEFINIPRPTNEELEELIPTIQQEKASKLSKENALKYLVDADWKRNRHLSQKALGITTSLSEEEYLAMESQCQFCRDLL